MTFQKMFLKNYFETFELFCDGETTEGSKAGRSRFKKSGTAQLEKKKSIYEVGAKLVNSLFRS